MNDAAAAAAAGASCSLPYDMGRGNPLREAEDGLSEAEPDLEAVDK